ncbi:MAG: pyrroline-5-carboxylate reductase [Granulosicoccus sp.]|nr:pyrroline-5-carboxylate reductase [Granulosicoccus sp.]
MRWIFVGAGNMASSLIGGLIASGAERSSVSVVDPDKAACKRASERFGIASDVSVASVMKGLPKGPLGLVIAVKPHVVEAVCVEFSRLYSGLYANSRDAPRPLLISVAAGVRASSMAKWLPDDVALVRCMPNTPALLGLGATAMFANPTCTGEQRQQAEALLSTAGATLWIEKESMLDAVTALSGSGPAYFFYLIEHMSAAGVALGLDAETAEILAIETAFGAASMARMREQTPSALRENVTSKGGTTAAALAVFDELGTPDIVYRAMRAANDRAVELGNQFSPV